MIVIYTAAVAATTGDTMCLCVVYLHFPPEFRSCPFYTCICYTHTQTHSHGTHAHRVQLVVGKLGPSVFQQIKAPNYCCFNALILNKLKFAYLSGGCLPCMHATFQHPTDRVYVATSYAVVAMTNLYLYSGQVFLYVLCVEQKNGFCGISFTAQQDFN